MKRGQNAQRTSRGFTIVETLVVLAVTGILFVAFAGTWLGKQHATEFQTASQDMRSRLQQMLSDVQNGYYSGDNVTCSKSGGVPSLSYDATGTKRGTSGDCIFLGKMVQFNVNNTDPQNNIIYGVAGLRGQTTMSTAKPTAMGPLGSYNPTEQFKSEYGLAFVGAKINTTTYRSLAVGFLSTLGADTDATTGKYTSGGQSFDLYAIGGGPNPGTESQVANNITTRLQLPPSSGGAAVDQPVQACFQSGGTNQYATITFGLNAGQLNANLQISSTNQCI